MCHHRFCSTCTNGCLDAAGATPGDENPLTTNCPICRADPIKWGGAVPTGLTEKKAIDVEEFAAHCGDVTGEGTATDPICVGFEDSGAASEDSYAATASEDSYAATGSEGEM